MQSLTALKELGYDYNPEYDDDIENWILNILKSCGYPDTLLYALTDWITNPPRKEVLDDFKKVVSNNQNAIMNGLLKGIVTNKMGINKNDPWHRMCNRDIYQLLDLLVRFCNLEYKEYGDDISCSIIEFNSIFGNYLDAEDYEN
jgi:hypothetical protein